MNANIGANVMSEYQPEIDRVFQYIRLRHPCNCGEIARNTGVDIRLVHQIVVFLNEMRLIESEPERPWVYRPVFL